MGYSKRYLGCCLEIMKQIPDGSVDCIITDLPYGTTACKWDVIIPFEPLWGQYKRVIKKNGAIVLFGAEPFSSHLRLSNLSWFEYDWIWIKSRASGFTNAKNKPMNKHELISVFSEGTTTNRSNRKMPYLPQGLIPYGKTVSGIKTCKADLAEGGHKFSRPGHKESFVREFTNYPTQILEFNNEGNPIHPTQKSLPLIEYLIRTYTNESETVLDSCAGSFTTAIACINTNRKYICIERDPQYFEIGRQRISNHIGQLFQSEGM